MMAALKGMTGALALFSYVVFLQIQKMFIKFVQHEEVAIHP